MLWKTTDGELWLKHSQGSFNYKLDQNEAILVLVFLYSLFYLLEDFCKNLFTHSFLLKMYLYLIVAFFICCLLMSALRWIFFCPVMLFSLYLYYLFVKIYVLVDFRLLCFDGVFE